MSTIDGQQISLFPTRVWIFPPQEAITNQLPALVDAMLNLKRSGTPGSAVPRSGRSCWRLEEPHLRPDFEQVYAHIRTLLAKVCSANDMPLGRRRFGSWIDVMEEGGSHVAHHHAPNCLSGVFYLAVPPGSSALMLRDPRPAKVINDWSSSAAEIPVRAEPGATIIFPAWLEHYVEPSPANGDRMALSFNLGETTDSAIRAQ